MENENKLRTLNSVLKSKGIKKVWFIKNVMELPPGSYYHKAHAGTIPENAIRKACEYLNVSSDEITFVE